ncbi:iron-containing alcohol dehydrogenase [Vibrio sp. ZSDZ65]|uniref:Iron-containing alcohol dehydrogenase n=1 Tax=Vibrio qingdaonensis TaxID=2829491 RepID=A0A9X3HV33_9VIBR|nr:iron-containing alcohol dehydrogenase [Vibrio qingdaonensis]MCW8344813.1 iron-containing alcohol dehydrogenase [Vibrio qingdaonensis]
MVFALNLPKLSLSGVGAVAESVAVLAGQSVKKVMIVTDKNLIELGLLDSLYQALDDKGFDYVTFDHVTPNPTVSLVNEGAEFYKKNACDCLIAVGGGSPIDCAKAIRIVTSNDGNITVYNGVGLVKNKGAFFIAINTTAGTAAEMTSNSVITDEVNHVKMVIVDTKQIPDVAVNDPSLMVGLPASVTAATGMDALTHAIESIVTPGAHRLTLPTALEAVKLITKWLPVAVKEGANIEARSALADAQFLAGMSFNSAGLGAVHALSHQPSATHNLAHGVCNAILLPVVSEFNAQTVPSAFRPVAEAMGGDTSQLNDHEAATLAVDLIRKLSSEVGIPTGLACLGIEHADIDGWVQKAMDDVCMGGNPRTLTYEEVFELYKLAL